VSIDDTILMEENLSFRKTQTNQINFTNHNKIQGLGETGKNTIIARHEFDSLIFVILKFDDPEQGIKLCQQTILPPKCPNGPNVHFRIFRSCKKSFRKLQGR